MYFSQFKFLYREFLGFLALATTVLVACKPPESKPVQLPVFYENLADGTHRLLNNSQLFPFEKLARNRFNRDRPPDEVFVMAYDSPIYMSIPQRTVRDLKGLRIIELRGEQGSVLDRTYGEPATIRQLRPAEVDAIRAFARSSPIRSLARLDGERKIGDRTLQVVSGREYVLVHLTPAVAYRAWANNPPTEQDRDTYPADHFSWQHAKVVQFFEDISSNESLPTTRE